MAMAFICRFSKMKCENGFAFGECDDPIGPRKSEWKFKSRFVNRSPISRAAQISDNNRIRFGEITKKNMIANVEFEFIKNRPHQVPVTELEASPDSNNRKKRTIADLMD